MPQIFHINPDNINQAIIDNTERGSSTDISNLDDTLYLDIVNLSNLKIHIDQHTSGNDLPQNQAFIELNTENATRFLHWITQTRELTLRINQKYDNLQCSYDIANNIILIIEQLDFFTRQIVEERASFTINNHNIQPLKDWLGTFFSIS